MSREEIVSTLLNRGARDLVCVANFRMSTHNRARCLRPPLATDFAHAGKVQLPACVARRRRLRRHDRGHIARIVRYDMGCEFQVSAASFFFLIGDERRSISAPFGATRPQATRARASRKPSCAHAARSYARLVRLTAQARRPQVVFVSRVSQKKVRRLWAPQGHKPHAGTHSRTLLRACCALVRGDSVANDNGATTPGRDRAVTRRANWC